MKYVVGIPYVNRPDLLRLAVNSIQPMWPHTFLLDNSETGEIERNKREWPVAVRRATPGLSLSFAESMNVIGQAARDAGCAFYFFMHNDAEAHAETAQRFLSLIEEAQKADRKWGVAFTHYDTFAALNMEAVNRIGPWDTNLPQYFSDNDYYRRMRLAGYEIIDTGLPVTHHANASATIKSDAKRGFLNSITFPLYREYYRRKWGAYPPDEHFTRPFDSELFPDPGRA